MDEEDFSWVRRSRFSHSVVRSNSGREQFGAFMEQFNRGAALRQEAAGSDSRFRLHGMNLELTTRTSATANNSARPPAIARTRSLDVKPTTDSSSSLDNSKPMQHGDHGHPSQTNKEDGGAGNGVLKGGGDLFVDVCCQPEVQEPKNGSPGPLEFSFRPDEQSMRLQRVCSSPSPFPSKEIPAFDAPPPRPTLRSSSFKLTGEERTPMLRARSPIPSRPVPQVFEAAKSDSKRFCTPPPRGKCLSPPRVPTAAEPLRAPGKVKHKKDQYWDNARAKAAALKVLDRWTVDRSKLLIGKKFASGAHSHLFHGIYMEVPCAVKFIRQPEDEQNADLASQLEKQFHTEVATLSRLQHRNVIKVTS